ncbi:hypothetical protein Ac2012v2_003098 [Leucoagaricus gongylophorus]
MYCCHLGTQTLHPPTHLDDVAEVPSLIYCAYLDTLAVQALDPPPTHLDDAEVPGLIHRFMNRTLKPTVRLPQSRSYLVPSDLIRRTSRYRPQDLPFAFVLDTSCPGKTSTNP